MSGKLCDLLRTSRLTIEGYVAASAAGVCMRCCLRFAVVQDMDAYAHSEEELREALTTLCSENEAVSLEAVESTRICTCCVGVLDDSFHSQVMTKVRQIADERKYDVTTFALNIKLPSVVLLREYSLLHYLRKNHSISAPYDMKDTLKTLITEGISKAINNADCTNSSPFAVLIDVKHEESAEEVMQIPAVKLQVDSARKRRRGPQPVFDGFGAVNRALTALRKVPESLHCPPRSLATYAVADVTFEREPVYLQGRYLKFQRGLSQTPWVLDGVRMGESSVEESIGDIALPYFRGSSYKFHTAGREDVDVRMLGNGRPFILEVLDAKTANLTDEEYTQIESAVNAANTGAVEIRQTKASTKDYFAGLQAGADSKKKTYCCVVWTERELTDEVIERLNGINDLTIQQQTPIRVLHRRTLMTRPKIIHAASCEVLNKHYMLLRLMTSAGTYVKEFVHGDRGRTQPNVSSILECDADILQLDVENLLDAQ